MGGAAAASWRVAIAGILVLVAGVAAILLASVQGMALVPDGSIVDGYWVGLLPWTEVGSWLVPLGGVIASLAALGAIWLQPRAGRRARAATIPAVLVVGFWAFLIVIGTAPRNWIDGSSSSSSVATVVYSNPVNTILFLLVPTAVLLVLAATTQRGRAEPTPGS